MKSNALARARLIFCMAVWGTLGLFVRNISVSSQELALYRALLALMMIGGRDDEQHVERHPHRDGDEEGAVGEVVAKAVFAVLGAHVEDV